jgi:hypothetical protein
MITLPKNQPKTKGPETVSRNELIKMLRTELGSLTNEETSICKAAAEHGVFCHGFSRYGDNELRRRYGWIVRKRPDMTREELETVANDWQLAQQEVHETPLACDVQHKVQDTCGGWSDFTNEELVAFYQQITGKVVSIA